MTDDQFFTFLCCLGFGFGSIFWFFVYYIIFGWKGGAK